MLEIIALIFLCRKIGNIAERKGLKPGTWKFMTVLSWILCEFAGVILGVLLFGKDNIFGILSLGLVSAFGGYLIVRAILDKRPDSFEDDIENLGAND